MVFDNLFLYLRYSQIYVVVHIVARYFRSQHGIVQDNGKFERIGILFYLLKQHFNASIFVHEKLIETLNFFVDDVFELIAGIVVLANKFNNHNNFLRINNI